MNYPKGLLFHLWWSLCVASTTVVWSRVLSLLPHFGVSTLWFLAMVLCFINRNSWGSFLAKHVEIQTRGLQMTPVFGPTYGRISLYSSVYAIYLYWASKYRFQHILIVAYICMGNAIYTVWWILELFLCNNILATLGVLMSFFWGYRWQPKVLLFFSPFYLFCIFVFDAISNKPCVIFCFLLVNKGLHRKTFYLKKINRFLFLYSSCRFAWTFSVKNKLVSPENHN